MNPKIFTIVKNNHAITYDVIATLKSTQTGKNYVIYTDNKTDSDNKLKIYAAIYNPVDFTFVSSDLDNLDWQVINKFLKNAK